MSDHIEKWRTIIGFEDYHPSLREAGRFVGKSNNISDITNCCKGYKKDGTPVYSAYGYIWKWKRAM